MNLVGSSKATERDWVCGPNMRYGPLVLHHQGKDARPRLGQNNVHECKWHEGPITIQCCILDGVEAFPYYGSVMVTIGGADDNVKSWIRKAKAI